MGDTPRPNMLDALLLLQDRTTKKPPVVVISDQSRAQMSFVSAISRLQMAEGADKLGRCAIWVRKAPAPGLRWTVSLVRDYSFRQEQTGSEYSTGPDGWVQQPRRVTRLVTGNNDDGLVVEALRFGQLQALDCGTNPNLTTCINSLQSAYMQHQSPGTHEDLLSKAEAAMRRQFTPNALVLELYMPDAPQLSLFVLPRVGVNPVYKADPGDPGHTRTMAASYVSTSDALVVWTVGADQDASNSNALAIVRMADAASRCLGLVIDHTETRLQTYNNLPTHGE